MTSRLPLIGLIILLFAGAATRSIAAPPGSPLPPTPADSTSDSATIKGNRFRVLVGGGAVLQESVEPQFFPFANANYRWSPSFTRGKRPVVMGPTGEIGINIIIPYLKGGLEVRTEHLFFDGHAGFTMGYIAGGHGGGFAFIPFVGAEGGYMFDIGGVRMEIETGINGSMEKALPVFPYATIGVAF